MVGVGTEVPGSRLPQPVMCTSHTAAWIEILPIQQGTYSVHMQEIFNVIGDNVLVEIPDMEFCRIVKHPTIEMLQGQAHSQA